ncbi:MAG: hypothetical protein K8S25_16225, partial [Alphaproteobacteria bacterium]|nr:hypothetical protein [Alphaproteobacteria bacterium]
MERIEPSNVRAFTGPLINEQPARDNTARDNAARESNQQHHVPPADTTEPPRVEVTPVHLSADSGGIAAWGSFLFIVFWLGGIGAYLIGLFGLDRIQHLPTAWYGLISAILIVPVILTVFIWILAREAKILRRQSSSLAVAAMQLTEPEDHAARGMTRLGRAIRRELDVFNTAVESATARMASLETATNDRMALIERTAIAAQERVDRATGKLGSEREKLAQFTQALDTAVLAASETLTARLHDARHAARNASESLHAEHGAIAGLISTLQAASSTVASKASESAKEIERQAQRLDAASEAAAARSEQVVARHERQRAALAETIERLKNENDHMARALDYQREGMNKLVVIMNDETKKIGTFTIEGARRLDETAAIMAQRIVETTQLFTRESEKLRTSTELTTSGLEQAMQTIRTAGDNSFDAAGRLGSVLIGLRETASGASQQIETTVGRLSKILQELPAEAAIHAQHLRTVLDQQAGAITDLSSRVSVAFDRVQAIEGNKQPAAPSLKPPAPQQSIPNFSVPPTGHLAPPNRGQIPQPADRHLPPEVPGEARGWFGLAKRFGRAPGEGPEPTQQDDRHTANNGGNGSGNGWDMKKLLAAAETRDGQQQPQQHQPHPQAQHPAHPQHRREQRPDAKSVSAAHGQTHQPGNGAQHGRPPAKPAPFGNSLAPTDRGTPQSQANADGNHTSSRHMIETLQAMAIDLDRFLEDDPPLDLLRRYRNGERNVFARRLVSILGREQTARIGQKYDEDGEFRETVDRYVNQFETLMEQTARSDRENVLVETYLTSQTGKVYVA